MICLIIFFICKVNAQVTITLQPGPDEGKDAYISNYYEYLDLNFGDYPNLFATAWTAYGYSFVTRSVFEFDLSVIPPGAEILDAKLSLYWANNSSNQIYNHGENQTYLRRITTPWEEYQITWNNQPATTTQNQVILKSSTSPTQDYEDIGVRPLIEDILQNPDESFGFMIKLAVEVPLTSMLFASSDFEDPSHRPKLVITYMGCESPQASFDYSIEDNLARFYGHCTSDSVTEWYWEFGDGNGSYDQNPVNYFESNGSYEVCLKVTDTCSQVEFCDSVQICDIPVSRFSWSANHLLVQFHDSSEFAESYYWDFGDGNFSILQNPLHYFANPGDYNVCLNTQSDCASDTLCNLVSVEATGIGEINSAEDLVVYPIPCKGSIFVKSIFPGDYNLNCLIIPGD